MKNVDKVIQEEKIDRLVFMRNKQTGIYYVFVDTGSKRVKIGSFYIQELPLNLKMITYEKHEKKENNRNQGL